MKRRSFTLLLIVLALLVPLVLGMLVSAAERGHELGGTRKVFLAIGRFPDKTIAAVKQIRTGSYQVIPNEFGTCGSQLLAEGFRDSNFVLISAYDPEYRQSTIELIRIVDGEVMHRWVPPLDDDAFKVPEGAPGGIPIKANARFFHPELMDDGSLVFCGSPGPLVCLYPDSRVKWVLKGYFHHSVEVDEENNVWTCGFVLPSRFDSLVEPDVFEENTLVKVSASGELMMEKSVADLLIENGLEGLLLGTSQIEKDPMHLNDVEPAPFDGPYWRKGDVLLSLRNKSYVCLYRPSENRILWDTLGNWINQHDVDFIDSTRISLFGNDMIRIPFGADLLFTGHNDVYYIDLADGSIETPYTAVMAGMAFGTTSEGLSRTLPGGRLMIEDSNHGRLVICDTERPLWSYTRCIGEKSVSILSWSRYVEKDRASNLLVQ